MLRRDFLKTVTTACGLCLIDNPAKIITDLAELEDSGEVTTGIQYLPSSKILIGRNNGPFGIERTHDMNHIRMLADSIRDNGMLCCCIGAITDDRRSVHLVCGFARMHALKLLNPHKDFDVWIDVRELTDIEMQLVSMVTDCSRGPIPKSDTVARKRAANYIRNLRKIERERNGY